MDAAVTGAALLLENLPLDFNARLLKEVAAVTPEEVKRLASKYLTQFLQCFGSAQENGECFSTLSVVTRTEKVKTAPLASSRPSPSRDGIGNAKFVVRCFFAFRLRRRSSASRASVFRKWP